MPIFKSCWRENPRLQTVAQKSAIQNEFVLFTLLIYYVSAVVVVVVLEVGTGDIHISTWTSSPRVVVGSRVELRCTATTTGQPSNR